MEYGVCSLCHKLCLSHITMTMMKSYLVVKGQSCTSGPICYCICN